MPDPSIVQPSPHSTPQSPSRLRALANAAVVLLAAVGSIATSPARWHVAAAPVAKASNGKGQLVTVEASAEPTVMAGNGSIIRHVRAEGQTGAWTGRADYFIPPSEALTSVGIMGTCSGGFCSKCEPPPGAFARIVSTVEVVPWVLDATYPPANIDLSAQGATATFRVTVEATRPPAFSVKLASPTAAGFYVSELPGNPSTDAKDDPLAAKHYAFSIVWYRDAQAAAGPFTGAWTPIVTISGYCKEPGPCVAPTSEKITIVSVEGPPPGNGTPMAAPTRGVVPVGSAGP